MSESSAAFLSEIRNEERENIVMSHLNASPLHLAALSGNLESVKRVVHQIPELVEAMDSRRQTPLHIASAKGHIDIVQELLLENANMCTSRDIDGRNPLHVAVVNGKVGILEVLLRACPLAAQARADRDETILHLCVKYNQLQVLELLLLNPKLRALVNAKDADGNTISHLAAADTNMEIVKVICGITAVDMNVMNTDGHTALDMIPVSEPVEEGSTDTDSSDLVYSEEGKGFKNMICRRGARAGKDVKQDEWLAQKENSIMVVAALIATVAFQAAMSPPGGVWQDDSDGHKSGETVMAYKSPHAYALFLRLNTLSLLMSLTIIFSLLMVKGFRVWLQVWHAVVLVSVAVLAMAFSYAISVTMLTPYIRRKSWSEPIMIGTIAWAVYMAICLCLTPFTRYVVRLNRFLAGKRRKGVEVARQGSDRSASQGQTPSEIQQMEAGPMHQEWFK